jgi:hypothetical protein
VVDCIYIESSDKQHSSLSHFDRQHSSLSLFDRQHSSLSFWTSNTFFFFRQIIGRPTSLTSGHGQSRISLGQPPPRGDPLATSNRPCRVANALIGTLSFLIGGRGLVAEWVSQKWIPKKLRARRYEPLFPPFAVSSLALPCTSLQCLGRGHVHSMHSVKI